MNGHGSNPNKGRCAARPLVTARPKHKNTVGLFWHTMCPHKKNPRMWSSFSGEVVSGAVPAQNKKNPATWDSASCLLPASEGRKNRTSEKTANPTQKHVLGIGTWLPRPGFASRKKSDAEVGVRHWDGDRKSVAKVSVRAFTREFGEKPSTEGYILNRRTTADSQSGSSSRAHGRYLPREQRCDVPPLGVCEVVSMADRKGFCVHAAQYAEFS